MNNKNLFKIVITGIINNSNTSCEQLISFYMKIDEIGRIGIVNNGNNEFIITIKGRYWITNNNYGEDTIVFNTNKGVISWRTTVKEWDIIKERM